MPTAQEQQIIDEWFADNQLRITLAVIAGMLEVDTVAQMMVDGPIKSAEQWRQFFDGLDTAGRGVLAEHVAEAFRRAFSNAGAGLREALVHQSGSIVRENIEEYIQILMALSASLRSEGCS